MQKKQLFEIEYSAVSLCHVILISRARQTPNTVNSTTPRTVSSLLGKKARFLRLGSFVSRLDDSVGEVGNTSYSYTTQCCSFFATFNIQVVDQREPDAAFTTRIRIADAFRFPRHGVDQRLTADSLGKGDFEGDIWRKPLYGSWYKYVYSMKIFE